MKKIARITVDNEEGFWGNTYWETICRCVSGEKPYKAKHSDELACRYILLNKLNELIDVLNSLQSKQKK